MQLPGESPGVPSGAFTVKRTRQTPHASKVLTGESRVAVMGSWFDSGQRVLRTKWRRFAALVMPHGVFPLSESCGSAGGRQRHRNYFLPLALADCRPQRGYFARRRASCTTSWAASEPIRLGRRRPNGPLRVWGAAVRFSSLPRISGTQLRTESPRAGYSRVLQDVDRQGHEAPGRSRINQHREVTDVYL